MSEPTDVEIYSVGLLRDLALFVHSPDRSYARRVLRRSVRYVLGQAKARNWRAAKSYFNGYLAEPRHDVPGFTRCGTGWTRGRAYRDLIRRLRAADSPAAARSVPTPGAGASGGTPEAQEGSDG